MIFRRYLELGSVNELVRDLKERNIRTRAKRLATGTTRGGIPFGRGALYYVLSIVIASAAQCLNSSDIGHVITAVVQHAQKASKSSKPFSAAAEASVDLEHRSGVFASDLSPILYS